LHTGAGGGVRDGQAQAIGALAVRALHQELALEPKPGLVTPSSRGSHDDMDHATFVASISAIGPYFAECARLGAADVDFPVLQQRGLRAERAMYRATGGVNTHKGAIFSLGLLCAAAGRQLCVRGIVDMPKMGQDLCRRWGVAIGAWQTDSTAAPTHGDRCRLAHGIPGAREQAAAGFPALFSVTFPALCNGLQHGAGPERAGIHALMTTIAVIADTNLVFRGGPAGLAWAQKTSEVFVHQGSAFSSGWLTRLRYLCGAFEDRRLSPGGSADLLAAAWFLHGVRHALAGMEAKKGDCLRSLP
jgi:triphosphoribosyl-dephospho-CoA synthase